MIKFFLYLYDHLSRHRITAMVLMVLCVIIGIVLALRLRYNENVSDFLPVDAENARYTAIYNQMGEQGQITIIFRAKDTSHAIDNETLANAIEDFEQQWESTNSHTPIDATLVCRIDDSQAMESMDLIRKNIALFLTPDDYHRADSLLADPDYIATSLSNVKRILSQPIGSLAVESIAADPLNLFSPALQRLQGLSASNSYQILDDYLFDATGTHAFAFLSSPFNSNDTRNNGRLADKLQLAIDSTIVLNPKVMVSAVGAPLIAVSNARQIKQDSFIAIALAVILIAIILGFTIGRRRNLLWLGFSIAFGWLFALACISLFSTSISIIVIGIGSVLVGIAVNYPLHFMDHIKDHLSMRDALKDMVNPLVIGNITTVSAFACLVFVKAEAMRDLGLFGALMLIGTILFVMIFLPLLAKPGKSRNRNSADSLSPSLRNKSNMGLGWRIAGFATVVILTILFGIKSSDTEFDSDLHNINYITEQQQADLALLSQSLESDTTSDLIYLACQGHTLQDALERNAKINEQSSRLSSCTLSGIGGLLPSLEQQELRISLWNNFVTKHANLSQSVKQQSVALGFNEEAFQPFLSSFEKSYTPLSESTLGPILALAEHYIFLSDSNATIVNFLHSPKQQTESLKATLRDTLGPNAIVFSTNDVGNHLVSALSEDFNFILYVCSFVVFFFLWISFGSLELSILAFLPLTVGWIWILGLMGYAGVKFNIVNIILATFIFGQGDDYTIFITDGLVSEYAYGKQRLQGFRRSVILSALLMFCGIGTLIIAKHPAMRSLAEVAIIGMAVVVFMACCLPPFFYHWMTRSHGAVRDVPVTIKRLCYTAVSLLVFIIAALFVVTPLTFIYRFIGRDSEAKRLRYHKMIQAFNRIAIKIIPGVKFVYNNEVGETFDKPAVLVANHQSHLDLLCMMMLTPKLVILTKDWVWHNPIYGAIIRYAEFYPVSDGYDTNLDRLKDLVRRGYSVAVFPEGTRSTDCQVHRFHKGAFQLAQALQVDILPIFLHGNGHVMPKTDPILREGELYIEVGHRIAPCTSMDSVLEQSKQIRHLFVSRYADICHERENEQYYIPLARYQYMLKGRDVWHRKPGFSQLVHALAHPDEQVIVEFDNHDDCLLLQHFSVCPPNLTIVEKGESL